VTRLEALECLTKTGDVVGTVDEVVEAIETMLSDYFVSYVDRHEVFHRLTNGSVIKLFSAVEIEQRYLDEYGSRIVIRCNDKYAHVFIKDVKEGDREIQAYFTNHCYSVERLG
jgi:sporulation protein YlmC with PRC-barrel domain